VLRIFIAIKNPSSSARFESAYLESNGKHDNQWNTEGNWSRVKWNLTGSRTLRVRLVASAPGHGASVAAVRVSGGGGGGGGRRWEQGGRGGGGGGDGDCQWSAMWPQLAITTQL
jgi:hypothetical protein